MYYLTEILKHIRQLCFCASSAVLSLSTDVGNNYELLFSVSSTHHVTMSNKVQQTEVKLNTQTVQPVTEYNQ